MSDVLAGLGWVDSLSRRRGSKGGKSLDPEYAAAGRHMAEVECWNCKCARDQMGITVCVVNARILQRC